jgi:hypothetical protein
MHVQPKVGRALDPGQSLCSHCAVNARLQIILTKETVRMHCIGLHATACLHIHVQTPALGARKWNLTYYTVLHPQTVPGVARAEQSQQAVQRKTGLMCIMRQLR